ncbi:MAG: hypothetical protein GF329_19430 [Candidatus Lokiarchaeota archaeon]|nr:hypothetical protein [Candidatus Lokiarchaeota archaeon]
MCYEKLKFLFSDNIDKGKNFYYKLILENLDKTKYIKTEDFIEILELDKKDVRKLLYRLFDLGIITHKYVEGENIWRLRKNSIDAIIAREKSKKLNEIKKELEQEKEKNYFFICKKCDFEVDYFEAFRYDFKCPNCGIKLVAKEESSKIESLEKEIDSFDVS